MPVRRTRSGLVYVEGKIDFDRYIRKQRDIQARKLDNPAHVAKLKRKRKRVCCEDPRNLRYAPWMNDKLSHVTLKCRKCGAVHHNLACRTGQIGFGGSSVR